MSEGLTDKQRAFVEAYLACGFNATEAARRAGYSDRTAHAIGWENLRKPDIAAAIQQGLSERAMSADEVLARLAEQARGTMIDFLDEAGDIDLKQARDRGRLHLVKSRSVTKEGERIELYDAQAALALLGKHHKLFTDRTEVSGPDGAAIPLEIARIDYRNGFTEAEDGSADDPAAPGED